ncbi:SH3 domain-containing protein (plasmid) [Actinacidiphila glaucinigra]|uniref:SH3 domain-containing protein n=1 Tax=Actinacidiphila glaucinigra TaxID=235986 RepID=UPI002DDB093C|nr:SH3 domain-containing protein [Actinacidiphila glaucinigra]WSD65889.1 SH3 domain-containing protein [Actinacidiphila glaucinigra]
MKLKRTAAAFTATAALLGGGIALAPTASAVGSSACTANVTDQDVWPYSDGLRLRSGPSTTYSAKGLLYGSDRLTVRCRKGSWYYISTDTKTRTGIARNTYGWISGSYINWQTCSTGDAYCPYNR